MDSPLFVRPKPGWFRFVPFLSKPVGNTLYPFIFLPSVVFENLSHEIPNPYYVALLKHEEVHYTRQKQMGLLLYALRYIFDSKFRFEEELAGVRSAMRYLKTSGIPVTFNNEEKLHSERLFAWPVSNHYSVEKLYSLYEDA